MACVRAFWDAQGFGCTFSACEVNPLHASSGALTKSLVLASGNSSVLMLLLLQLYVVTDCEFQLSVFSQAENVSS